MMTPEAIFQLRQEFERIVSERGIGLELSQNIANQYTADATQIAWVVFRLGYLQGLRE